MQLADDKIELVNIENNPVECLANLYHKHQTLTGLGIREYDLLPQIRQGDRITDEPWIAKIRYKVALDNFRSAFNVGSIFRVCDAVGFEEVILGGYSPAKINPRVKKTAMGSTEWIPESISSDLPNVLSKHSLAGYEIIGLETVADTVVVDQFKWPERGVIVIGNEENGISQAVMTSCTKFVSIPMYGRKNSLNVANAFSIVAYSISSSLTARSEK
jgi:tRNA G18 (ribose-2'-O)-methylase SpoU